MPTIKQPTIHTKVTIYYRSGRKVTFRLGFPVEALNGHGPTTDVKGVTHQYNSDMMEHVTLQKIDAAADVE